MTSNRNHIAWGLVLMLLLLVRPASADMAMAFVELSLMQLGIIALVVVAIETGALKAVFKQSFGSLVGLVAVVNLVSYLAGLPILWLISSEGPLYALINQYENPLLSMGLMLAAFVLTVLVETPLLVRGLRKDKGRVFRACLGANVASYLLLVLLTFPFTYFPDYGMRALFRPPADGTEQPVEDDPFDDLEPLERPESGS